MAGSATDYLRQRVLSHTLAFGAYAAPSAVYIALCAAGPTVPSNSQAGLEIAVGGYARQLGAFGLAAARYDLAENTATIEYPPATANWGSIGYFEIWDAVTAGNRLFWGPLVDPMDGITPIARNVLSGDIVRFSAGVIQVEAL